MFSVTYALTQRATATTRTAGRDRLLAFIAYVNYYTKSGLLPWNMEEQTSETSAAICPAIQRHILEDSNHQYRLQLLSPALKNLLKQQTVNSWVSCCHKVSSWSGIQRRDLEDLRKKLQVTSDRTERVACRTHRTVNCELPVRNHENVNWMN